VKRFKTYLTEIDNVVNALPEPEDPFKRTLLDRLLDPEGGKISPEEKFRDILGNKPNGGGVPGGPSDDDIKDAIKRGTAERKKNIRRILDTPESKKALGNIDALRDELKRTKGPGNLENFGLTKDDMKQLRAIEKARNAAAGHVDDVAKETRAAASKLTPKELKKIGKQLDLFHAQEKAEEVARRSKEQLSHSISRMHEWERLGKPGYEESRFDPAHRGKRAATTGQRAMSRLGQVEKAVSGVVKNIDLGVSYVAKSVEPVFSAVAKNPIVSAVAKNPVTRRVVTGAGRVLGVAAPPLAVLGVYSDAQIAAKMSTAALRQEMERAERQGRDPLPNPELTNPGFKF